MEEKLIIISIEEEIVDSFLAGFYNLQYFIDYCMNNKLWYIGHMEFCGFVFVDAKWR